MRLELHLPLRIKSAANLREHWAVKAKRVAAQRNAVRLAWKSACSSGPRPTAPCRVTLTRVGPGDLDSDNLLAALKAVRDQIAAELGLDDSRRSPITWFYRQRRGGKGVYALEVAVEPALVGCPGCHSASLDHLDDCACWCHGAPP